MTIRTLHYYDEIGLLSPSHHTESGHRLYGTRDVIRLQQIKSLRALGFSLEEIRECLLRPDFSPLRTIELHLARLRDEIEMRRQLYERLETLHNGLSRADELSAAEFMQVIGAMSVVEKYYTPEQLEALERRRQQVGDARIREVQAEWPRLIEQVRRALERGDDPASEPAMELARRWMGLVREFSGGDPAIERSLKAMYTREPGMVIHSALDPALFAYVERAIAAAGLSPG
jgi:DNA-binding transcriptional MerR regulator